MQPTGCYLPDCPTVSSRIDRRQRRTIAAATIARQPTHQVVRRIVHRCDASLLDRRAAYELDNYKKSKQTVSLAALNLCF